MVSEEPRRAQEGGKQMGNKLVIVSKDTLSIVTTKQRTSCLEDFKTELILR